MLLSSSPGQDTGPVSISLQGHAHFRFIFILLNCALAEAGSTCYMLACSFSTKHYHHTNNNSFLQYRVITTYTCIVSRDEPKRDYLVLTRNSYTKAATIDTYLNKITTENLNMASDTVRRVREE